MTLTTTQILMIIAGTLIVGFGIFKLIPLLKNKNIPDDEKNTQVEKIAIDVIKKMIHLASIKSYDKLKDICVKEIRCELKRQGVNDFTEDELNFIVDGILKAMIQQIEKVKKHRINQ